jgi:hypothetical protein
MLGRRVTFIPRRDFAAEGFTEKHNYIYDKSIFLPSNPQNYPMDYLMESIRVDFANRFFRYCYEWCESIVIRAALRYKFTVKKNKVKRFADEIEEEIYHLEKQLGIKRTRYKSKKKDDITELMEMDDLLNEGDADSDDFSTNLTDDNYY